MAVETRESSRLDMSSAGYCRHRRYAATKRVVTLLRCEVRSNEERYEVTLDSANGLDTDLSAADMACRI